MLIANGAEWRNQAAAFARLLDRAIPHAESLEEAVAAVDAAMAMDGTVASVSRFRNTEPVQSLDTFFAHDIFNRRAQSILNKAIAGMKDLSAAARRELKAAIAIDDPGEMSQAIIAFLQHYRRQLGELLGATNLSALLAGAREVADKMPPMPLPGVGKPPPPSLPPDAAAGLLSRLEAMPDRERAQAVYKLPADQQEWVNRALAIGTGPPLPPFTPAAPPAESPGAIHFPTIEEAIKDLSARNVVSRNDYDRLDAAARQKAFTVAGELSQETLEKIRDALAETVAEGADVEAFRQKVLERVEPGSFLSPAHMDVVARTNIQAGFSDGQMAVLNTPFVRSGYPYTFYNAIHDDRVRPEHLALESLGIQGTNIYRINDPVFQTFRPPWAYNDRCGWTPMSVKFAAEKGIKEAIAWLESGQEPSPPAFVPFPSFRPPPEFQRSLAGAPLSIQLSLRPMDLDAAFGMVGDEWHGPTAPAPGWVEVGIGPKGGKVWRRQGGGTQPAPAAKPQAQPRKASAASQATGILQYIQSGAMEGAVDLWKQVSPEDRVAVANKLPPEIKKKILEASARRVAAPPAAPTAVSVADNPILQQAVEDELPVFAGKAVNAAAATLTGGFGDNKVFISHVYETMKKTNPDLTIEDFKRRLVEANNAGHLTLSRADLIEVMRSRDVQASETFHPAGGEFHFILSNGQREQTRVNDEENLEDWNRAARASEEKERKRREALGFSMDSVLASEPEFAFGTEAPGEGWEYAGEMKWVRRPAFPDSETLKETLFDARLLSLETTVNLLLKCIGGQTTSTEEE